MLTLNNAQLTGKKVLIRSDLNVPLRDGKLLDATRIASSLPSIIHCLQGASKVIIMSHYGRPDPSKPPSAQPQFSLAPLAPILSSYLNEKIKGSNIEVAFAASINEALAMEAPCILLENTRFLSGETKNDEELSRSLASLCDVFVMDAFGSAHRAHASTAGVVSHVKSAVAGFLLEKEIAALTKVTANPDRPLLAIVGGAKVGDKLRLLEKLSDLADKLIVGGGIANTFLAAKGLKVGNSLYEPQLQDMALAIMNKVETLLPVDVVTATSIDAISSSVADVASMDPEQMILDVGSESLSSYASAISSAGTILWNGPLGVFEKPFFAKGTETLTQLISSSTAYSVAGGGETLAAINTFKGKVDYVSTGGGAFLEYVEQGSLPAIKSLEEHSS